MVRSSVARSRTASRIFAKSTLNFDPAGVIAPFSRSQFHCTAEPRRPEHQPRVRREELAIIERRDESAFLRVKQIPDAEDVGFAFFDGGVEILQRNADLDAPATRLRDVTRSEAVRQLVEENVVEERVEVQELHNRRIEHAERNSLSALLELRVHDIL